MSANERGVESRRLVHPGVSLATQDVERESAVEERRSAEEITRLRLLLEASSTLLGTLSVDRVLPEVLDLARRTLAADAYSLWRLDQATDSWGLAIQYGLPEDYVEASARAISGNSSTVPLDAPIVAVEIETAEWLTPEHREAHASAGTKSMLVIPMRYGDRVLGTLVFYYREVHRFSEGEMSAASLLANLAAAAIGIADLYETQERLTEDQRFIAEASELLASSLV